MLLADAPVVVEEFEEALRMKERKGVNGNSTTGRKRTYSVIS